MPKNKDNLSRVCNTKMSSCLVPQFKCPPDTFLIHFPPSPNNHLRKHLSRSRRVLFRARCVLSSTSPSTSSSAVLDLEKPQLHSLKVSSNRLAANGEWPYLGMSTPSAEEKFQATLGAESLITSDEAVVAAATAEAVALAKAAVRVAKDAVLLAAQAESKPLISSETDNSRSKWVQLTEKERNSILGDVVVTETGMGEAHPVQDSEQSDDFEPTNEELEDLEKELSNTIAVRSGRQKERKARRARAAEKAAACVLTVNTGSSSRKKRGEVDYSDPLCFFRGAAGTSKLLTAAEELQLSAGIQDLLKLERLQKTLAERCGCQPTFSQWAVAAGVDQMALRKRLNYGTLCKDKMIKSNIRLVITIAKKYQGIGLNLQDLVQEGCRGLVKGAEKFDASKGFKFSTYAHWWIKQSVRKSLSDRSRTIRLPFHMVEASYRVKEAKKQLYTENGRHPDDEEVAEATGLSVKKVAAVLLTPKAPGSLDQKIGIDENLKPSEVIADPDAETVEELLMKQFLKQDLEKVLDRLSPRENQVIRWRFGLDDGRMKTLQEIGESMGVSRERVRQIESSAFRKLKNKKRIKHLQQYMIS